MNAPARPHHPVRRSALRAAVAAVALSAALGAGIAAAQGEKGIPVFPGARLVVPEGAGAGACCAFTTTAPKEQVVGFYEKELGVKAMGPKAFAERYPAMKGRVEAMAKRLPKGAEWLAFVVERAAAETTDQPVPQRPATPVEVFELLAEPGRVRFGVAEDSLRTEDLHHLDAWRKRTGKGAPGAGPAAAPQPRR